jgi:hypothetical protein
MTSEQERLKVARAEAMSLGYMLFVEEAPNLGPTTHVASAVPHPGYGPHAAAIGGHFLAYGASLGEAAEGGVDVLRGIVERGEPWPRTDG